MGWERGRGLPGEIDPGEELPEDLSLDLSRTSAAAAAELLDQLRELGAADLQILLREARYLQRKSEGRSAPSQPR